MRISRFLLLLMVLWVFAPQADAASWEMLETENFQFYYTQGKDGPARRLSAVAENLRKQTSEAIGFDFKHKTRVYLAPDLETYQSVQPRAVIPEWSVGVAFTHENLIVLYTPLAGYKKGTGYDMVQVFHHELCHVMLGRALSNVSVPKWLNEGFAKLHAMEWSHTDTFRLTIAYFSGSLMPLEDLMFHWPRDERKARIAYLQSKVFVAYLERRGDLKPIIAYMQKGKPADSAIGMATGYPLAVLEQRWLNYLKRSHTWLFVLFRSEVVWSGAALLFLAAYWRVRLRKKRKLRRMELEEELESHYVDKTTLH